MPCMFTTGIAGPPNAATSMSSRSNFSIFIPFTPLLFFVLKPRTSRIARYLLGNLSCLSCCAVGQSICQATFNGEFCNNRDASVHADSSKSRFPERVAQALRGKNSLRVAMQIGGGACPCYLVRDCGPGSAQTEQSGETALVNSRSQRP